jgi:ADP-heptose:LPS heptosyltransferase
VISGAVLLITIDTVALHIAAALNKDFICIANGYYFGRFDPYPPEMQKKGVVLFPEEVDKNTGKVIELKYGVNLNINSIRPERVIDVIREILALK